MCDTCKGPNDFNCLHKFAFELLSIIHWMLLRHTQRGQIFLVEGIMKMLIETFFVLSCVLVERSK